jgi:hypothetical protein
MAAGGCAVLSHPPLGDASGGVPFQSRDGGAAITGLSDER